VPVSNQEQLPKEQRDILSKLGKLSEERKIVICRMDRNGKIVLLNYEDYNAIMIKELQHLEKWMRVR